jgi:glycosyltransferase involved in cell wall biosynthesis
MDFPREPLRCPGRGILFASAHAIVDPSNGASVATLGMLQGLACSGFEAHAFCTLKLDLPHEVNLEQLIGQSGEPYEMAPSIPGRYRTPILRTRRRGVAITLLQVDSTRHIPQRPEEIYAVLASFETFLEGNRPDVMLTYGGDPVTIGMIDLARRRGIPVVFAIHNLNYQDGSPLIDVDYRIVPSESSRRHYRNTIGLDCHVLPNPVDWERVWVADRKSLSHEAAILGGSRGESVGSGDEETFDGPGAGSGDPQPVTRDPGPSQEARARRRFVTFVNPLPEKGVGPFVRIAQELGRRRPDIPFLVVESRGNRQNLSAIGLGRDAGVNVQLISNTTDPRRFYAMTRITLIPSLCPETQSLVAIESMINGIPIIGSDRGAIPETLGACGFALSLPARLTPADTVVPEAEEVGPWIDTIIRLWDDRTYYEEQSNLARLEARRWHPDRLRPLYAEFFRSVRPGRGRSSRDGGRAPRQHGGRPILETVSDMDQPGIRPTIGSEGPTDRRGTTVNSSDPHALASIIIPCFNQAEFTRLCVQALFRHTRPPWELIVVDNGSTDDTAAYLAGVRDAASVPVTLITNPQNAGFPRAINQGLEVARGEYLVLLNNDAVVTDGWLDQLIALSEVRVDAEVGTFDGRSGNGGSRPEPDPEGRTAPDSGPNCESLSANAGSNGSSPGSSRPPGTASTPPEGGTPTVARPAPTIGLVGPMSNYAAPPQLIASTISPVGGATTIAVDGSPRPSYRASAC